MSPPDGFEAFCQRFAIDPTRIVELAVGPAPAALAADPAAVCAEFVLRDPVYGYTTRTFVLTAGSAWREVEPDIPTLRR